VTLTHFQVGKKFFFLQPWWKWCSRSDSPPTSSPAAWDPTKDTEVWSRSTGLFPVGAGRTRTKRRTTDRTSCAKPPLRSGTTRCARGPTGPWEKVTLLERRNCARAMKTVKLIRVGWVFSWLIQHKCYALGLLTFTGGLRRPTDVQGASPGGRSVHWNRLRSSWFARNLYARQ